MAVYGGSLGESNGAVLALGSNVRVWLQADIQPSEIEVCLPPRADILAAVTDFRL